MSERHIGMQVVWQCGRTEAEKILFLFSKIISRLESVADLGCGDGYGSMLLNNEGYDVIGMDISEEMIRIATKKEQSSLSFVVGDLNKPPFQDEQFSRSWQLIPWNGPKTRFTHLIKFAESRKLEGSLA